MNRVLVVDDNRDLGELTSEILEEIGFRVNPVRNTKAIIGEDKISNGVNIAFDGETALARIKQETYELMILDYRLPGISGLTVLEKTQQIRLYTICLTQPKK